MRERSLHVEHGLPMVVDVVGTGGDHANTINISTMAALAVAAMGIPVAKHGNRAASSACGSADVLESAGFRSSSRRRSRCGCCESSASPLCSRRLPSRDAQRRVVRRELGVRTIFNLLGPLTNPAGATHLVVGVAREELVEWVGRALQALGAGSGAVVHGASGIDEIASDGPTSSIRSTKRWAAGAFRPAAFGIRPLRARWAAPSRAAAMPSSRCCGALGPAADSSRLTRRSCWRLPAPTRAADGLRAGRDVLRSGAAWRRSSARGMPSRD